MLENSQIQSLLEKAKSLLILGFQGAESVSPSLEQCLSDRVGGVILFDIDAIPFIERGEVVTKNISSPQQLRQLNQDILQHHPDALLAIDHEGGLDRTVDEKGNHIRLGVTRLKHQYGFTRTLCAAEIGAIYQQAWQAAEQRGEENPQQHARRSIHDAVRCNAELVKQSGFNLVFAPVVDVHNEQCPIIGNINRAYARDIDVIIDCAREQITAYRELGIISCLKHLPGHGRARVDSHIGITDISAVWQAEELRPFQHLANECDMIMVGHLFQKQVDDAFPASISSKHVAQCRQFFSGVIVSDDYQMAGLTQFLRHYYADSLTGLNTEQADDFIFEKTVTHGLQAGIDLFIFGNQFGYIQPDLLLEKFLQVIATQILSGELESQVIEFAFQRVTAMKAKRQHDNISSLTQKTN